MKIFYKTPKVLKTSKGKILEVLRPHDNQILKVGQQTKSGGEILTIQKDKNAVGNMIAEIGGKGRYTAISCIVI